MTLLNHSIVLGIEPWQLCTCGQKGTFSYHCLLVVVITDETVLLNQSIIFFLFVLIENKK